MPQLNFQPFQPPQTPLPQNTIAQQMAAQQQGQGQQQGIPGMQEALKAIQGMYQKIGQPAQPAPGAAGFASSTTPPAAAPVTPASPAAAVTGLGQAGGTYAQGPSQPILSQMARPGINVAGVDARLGDSLASLYQSAPPDIQAALKIGSGVRTNEQQQRLYDDYIAGRGPLAARPGQSRHQVGTALDLYYGEKGTPQRQQVQQWVHQNAPRFGLAFPLMSKGEDWHVELARR